MFRRLTARLGVLAIAASCAAIAQPAFAQKIVVNEFYRAGNLGGTDEWVEVVLTETMTAAELEGFHVGDSASSRAAKFSGYRFTDMASIASSFEAGTIIVVTGTGGPAQDIAYDPAGGDWNLVLRTAEGHLASNGQTGDLAATDVVYVDTNGTQGDVTLSSDGFAVTWTSPASGAFALLANVAIAAPGNNTAAVLAGAIDAAATAANWTVSVPLASATPGQPNGGANTTSIEALRGPATALPVVGIVANASVAEGNPPTANTLVFQINVSPAPEAGSPVEFDVAISGDASRHAYTGPASLQVTDATTLPVTVEVQTVPNTDTDGDAPITLTLSNFSGTDAAQVDPLASIGTIVDDDLDFDAIHAIQGSGQISPFDGDVVTTRGIVTGLRNNAFYIQTPDAEVDADPATSEGLYVFVGNAANMPVGLAVGDLVYVQGTVDEYVPVADPNQLPITELVAPITVTPIANAQPLPTPIALNPDPAGALDQLERFESMRVSVADYTVTSPTADFADESFGVVTGTPRPFREEGVDEHDCGINLPDEAPGNVPCWDTNPELLRMKTNLLIGGAAIPLRTGTRLTNVVGVLDYAFRRYSILTRQAEPFTIVPGTEATGTAATVPTSKELTIGGFNVENLALAANATYERKAGKITTTLVDYMHTPDIVGFIEVANLATLEDIAARVNTAAANDPEYTAQMVSLSGTQRLGFLVKSSEVRPGVPRVEIGAIEEFGADLHVICPDGESETIGLLNDRAPLVMDVVVNAANGAAYPMTVINNHLKSLIGVDSLEDADASYACFNDPLNPGGGEGRRNRAKRQQNAEYLTELVADLQTQNPGRPIVLVGDFNAFQFNDGYADLMNTIAGTPAANDTTVVPGDGLDLLNPDLINLTDLVEDEDRYSYVFEGNAQVLDHILVNEGVVATTQDFRRETPRVNADFTTADANSTAVPFGNSDHDPAVGYLDVTAFHTADLDVGFTMAPTDAAVGDMPIYETAIQNLGPDTAFDVTWSVTLPEHAAYEGMNPPNDWACTEPTVGGTGTIACTIAELPPAVGYGIQFAFFVLEDASGTTLATTATGTTSSTDPTLPNLATAQTNVPVFSAAPVFDPVDSRFLVAAGATVGTQVGTVIAVDPEGGTVAYAITAGNDNGSFAIDANGVITVADATLLTHGALFQMTVSATDSDGVSGTGTVRIDVPYPFAFDQPSYTFEIDTDVADGAIVGQTSATHGNGDTLDYGFEQGVGPFTIDQTGLITVTDASQLVAGTYELVVSASDEVGVWVTAPVTVTVVEPQPPEMAIFADGFED